MDCPSLGADWLLQRGQEPGRTCFQQRRASHSLSQCSTERWEQTPVPGAGSSPSMAELLQGQK